MKTVLIIIGFLFASCSVVRFETPQPEKGREMAKFPKEFIGAFCNIAEEDTLYISTKEIRYRDELKKLSDGRVTLKKMGKYHILSCKELFLEGDTSLMKGWDVLPFKLTNDTLVVSYVEISKKDSLFEEELDEILSRGINKEFEKEGNTNTEYLLINPTKKEFKTILKQELFKEQAKFVRID